MPIRVGVRGAAGRMGSTVVDAVQQASDCVLAAAIDLGDDPDVLADCDVVVDFTNPDAVLGGIRACIARGVHCVGGTTGFDAERIEQVRGWCRQSPETG
ncbi:MAG: 4-hydroxy-tetrahydrodipicolinate reductase, partial [Actinomycetales bacterium]